MTDRELLEAAAKAAGYHYHGARVGLDYENCYVSTTGNTDDWFVWSPLNDDGAALRLAVDLGIAVSCRNGNAQAVYRLSGGVHGFSAHVDEPVGDDPYASTRRAIVRAAAAMAGGQK